MAKEKTNAPWMPADYVPSIPSAFQALLIGEADPEQQKRALSWIIEELCKTYDMSYRPDSQRDTDFAEGKRFVGSQIVKMTKLNVSKLKE